MSNPLLEEFRASERVASNPPDATTVAFSPFNEITRLTHFIAAKRDRGEDVDMDIVELAARDLGLGGLELSAFLEDIGAWF